MVARKVYRARLVALEDELLRVGEAYRSQLLRAVDAVVRADPHGAAALQHEDDRLDALADRMRDETIQLIALQSPVADELRLLTAVLEVGTAIEHIGESAVNVARGAHGDDPDLSEPLVQQFSELGTLVDRLAGRALERFARRRTDEDGVAALARQIAALRRHLQERAVDAGRLFPERVDWVVRLALATSWLERAGDMSVHIADQVPYLVGAPGSLPGGDITRIAR